MVDARGYSCPIPVVMTQKALDRTKAAHLDVLVDNQAAVQNITRFASARGYRVTVEQQEEDYLLKLDKN